MRDGDLLILKANEVAALLEGRENEIMEAVRVAYEIHGKGGSTLPHSLFLHFPDNARNRIIALPAYLNHDGGITGIKWVSSFPENLSRGLDRASAVLVLNSTQTGRPEAFIEGSLISAKRTAASAALAAQYLHSDKEVERAGMIGTGLINHEIMRFLLAALPTLKNFVVYDLDPDRVEQFKVMCESEFEGITVNGAADISTVLRSASLVSFATTAGEPHVADLNDCEQGSTILHVSLRDLSPEVILACDNVVDDVDHVCRARTSIHLAEQYVGNRDFVRCTLAQIFSGEAPPRRDEKSIAVFSPFGLGVLDIMLGKLVVDLAADQGVGQVVSSFLPEPMSAHQCTKTASQDLHDYQDLHVNAQSC
jgi:2,3-diaminopropionate biosynthesis protein SbnB